MVPSSLGFIENLLNLADVQSDRAKEIYGFIGKAVLDQRITVHSQAGKMENVTLESSEDDIRDFFFKPYQFQYEGQEVKRYSGLVLFR